MHEEESGHKPFGAIKQECNNAPLYSRLTGNVCGSCVAATSFCNIQVGYSAGNEFTERNCSQDKGSTTKKNYEDSRGQQSALVLLVRLDCCAQVLSEP